jgi:prephenate dehydrogenase
MGKIAIIGLGLIGGSMGLALKRARLPNTEIIGVDREYDVAQRAAKYGAVDRVVLSAEIAASEAGLVIVATPTINVRRVFEVIGPHLQRGAVVTDTASTKGEVLRWAGQILPENVYFVGGHPMAGKEKSGPQAAEASLFDDRPYSITPSVNAVPQAVNAIIGLAQAIGARPFFIDADEHDAYAAAISHVPLVASIALFSLARGSSAWPELANMSGPGFYDLTRLASGEPEMSHDICLTNKENISHWLDRYIGELRRLQELILSDDDKALFRMFAETQLERENFLLNPPRREEPVASPDLPSSNDAFLNLIAGGMWAQRAREITGVMEDRLKQREREDRLRRRE